LSPAICSRIIFPKFICKTGDANNYSGSYIISPPEIADVVVIALTAVVVKIARATELVVNATSFP
jgi:hypothetical protein